MIRFECDYLEGALPEVMKKLNETNLEQHAGYGVDDHCERARELIKELCSAPKADVHFLVGGTQANTTVIASALRTYEGVVSAVTGHINAHETGAIEATGHKVLALPTCDGKLTAEMVKNTAEAHINDGTKEHTVKPGMVYISHPTELGTIYSKAELTALSEVCREYKMPLFLDGARLGYALASEENDLTLPDIASLCDVFYIGGTKCGALFGEAVVIMNDSLKENFRYNIKQRGGMFAKGRLLGVQFQALLENGNYVRECSRAHKQAMRIKASLKEKGYKFLIDTPTNQQFPIIPDTKLKELSKKFSFSFQEKVSDTETAVRICTSVLTEEESVEKLIKSL